MLQASTVVTDAIAPGTGPRTAESEILLSHSSTEAVSSIRAAPHLLSPDQDNLVPRVFVPLDQRVGKRETLG